MADSEVLRLIVMCVSIVAGIALQTWGIIKYIIGRVDSGDNRLHDRVSEVSRTSVRRSDYDRDMERFHSELSSLRDDIKESQSMVTSRLDTLIFAMTSRDVGK